MHQPAVTLRRDAPAQRLAEDLHPAGVDAADLVAGHVEAPEGGHLCPGVVAIPGEEIEPVFFFTLDVRVTVRRSFLIGVLDADGAAWWLRLPRRMLLLRASGR